MQQKLVLILFLELCSLLANSQKSYSRNGNMNKHSQKKNPSFLRSFRFSSSKKGCSKVYDPCEPGGKGSGDADMFQCFAEGKSKFGICLKTERTSCVNSRACGYDLMCVGGYCESAKACKKQGQSCKEITDCCTNLVCDERTKKCVPCYECREQNEACYIDSQCRGWSLHCSEGVCTQCKDLVYKKGCMKYGYFCRTDDECRPNLRCYFLEFKDEYLCLGAKDFSEEEPENYKARKSENKILFTAENVTYNSSNPENNSSSIDEHVEKLRLKSRLKDFHLNNEPSEFVRKNFIIRNVGAERNDEIKDNNSTMESSVGKESIHLDALNKNSTKVYKIPETPIKKKVKIFQISKNKLVQPLLSTLKNSDNSTSTPTSSYQELYTNYLKTLINN